MDKPARYFFQCKLSFSVIILLKMSRNLSVYLNYGDYVNEIVRSWIFQYSKIN